MTIAASRASGLRLFRGVIFRVVYLAAILSGPSDVNSSAFASVGLVEGTANRRSGCPAAMGANGVGFSADVRAV